MKELEFLEKLQGVDKNKVSVIKELYAEDTIDKCNDIEWLDKNRDSVDWGLVGILCNESTVEKFYGDTLDSQMVIGNVNLSQEFLLSHIDDFDITQLCIYNAGPMRMSLDFIREYAYAMDICKVLKYRWGSIHKDVLEYALNYIHNNDKYSIQSVVSTVEMFIDKIDNEELLFKLFTRFDDEACIHLMKLYVKTHKEVSKNFMLNLVTLVSDFREFADNNVRFEYEDIKEIFETKYHGSDDFMAMNCVLFMKEEDFAKLTFSDKAYINRLLRKGIMTYGVIFKKLISFVKENNDPTLIDVLVYHIGYATSFEINSLSTIEDIRILKVLMSFHSFDITDMILRNGIFNRPLSALTKEKIEFADSVIDEHMSSLDIFKLSHNTLSIHFIARYKDILDWKILSNRDDIIYSLMSSDDYSEVDIKDYLDWGVVCRVWDISKDGIKRAIFITCCEECKPYQPLATLRYLVAMENDDNKEESDWTEE